jgi:hypothetical protein
MTAKDISTGLGIKEKMRYVEIAPGVYALLVAISDAVLTQVSGRLQVDIVGIGEVGVEEGSLSTIDHSHRMTHEGHLYGAYVKAPYSSELANNGELNIQITAIGHAVHCLWDAACGGDAELYVYAGPTTSSGATFTPSNRKSDGPAAGSAVKTGVTVSNTGAEKQYRFLTGGKGPNSVGGSTRGDNELIIVDGTTYLFRLYNRSGAPKIAHLALVFYEE